LQLLPEEFGKNRGERDLHYSFSSPLRDQALTLNALITAAPDNEQIGIIARQLSAELRQADYVSTQDASFALLSLGKLARQVANSNAQVSVWAGGKKIGEGPVVELGKEWLGKSVELRAKDGRAFYFWEASGLSSTGKVKEEDKLIKVRRSFFTRNGAPITNLSVKQGDLLVVRITLEMSARSIMPAADAQVLSDQRVSNVVVTDMLPAGLEIENPRLGRLPDIDWIKDADDPEYTDFRDDRVNFFVDAKPQPQHFYYVVRAVSKGKFKLGPVSADAMYSGEYHSYHGAGSFVIE
jgi:hypothetical protein